MNRYAEVFRVPHVAFLLVATIVARLPIGINGLAIVLYVEEVRGSFAIAGLAAGALALGGAAGAPFVGRLVDALGQRRVLLPLAVGHAAGLGAIVLLTEAGAPDAAIVLSALLAGLSMPPMSAVMRSMWPTLLRERPALLQPAYALDSVLIELIFILGPLLTAIATTVLSPAAALTFSVASVVIGTTAFTASPPSRAVEPQRRPHGSRLGALASPGVRTLAITSLPLGVGIGMCEVTLPAFSDASGEAATAGLLLAIWSLGSAAGGLVYGALPNRPPIERVWLLISFLLPLGLLPMAAATSVAVMAVLVIPAGVFLAPLLATQNELVARVAPEGGRTEAYTWPLTCFVGGIALGAAIAGVLVEEAGWRPTFLVAGALAAIAAVVAVARRSTVGPRAATAA